MPSCPFQPGRSHAPPPLRPRSMPGRLSKPPRLQERRRPWPSHFLFHLMEIRPDSGAVCLAIFRVRLCNFVEVMTKVHICSFQGGQRQQRQGRIQGLGRRLGHREVTPQKANWAERSDHFRRLGVVKSLCQEHLHFSAICLQPWADTQMSLPEKSVQDGYWETPALWWGLSPACSQNEISAKSRENIAASM